MTDDEQDPDPKRPRITAIAWKTPDAPDANREFDGVCPWCAKKADEGAPGISYGRTCATCGAIAWGAWAADYDEVVDDALNHFRIDPAKAGNERYTIGAAWWKACGIDVLPGGRSAEHAPMSLIYWYWFRRTPTVN